MVTQPNLYVNSSRFNSSFNYPVWRTQSTSAIQIPSSWTARKWTNQDVTHGPAVVKMFHPSTNKPAGRARQHCLLVHTSTPNNKQQQQQTTTSQESNHRDSLDQASGLLSMPFSTSKSGTVPQQTSRFTATIYLVYVRN